MMRFNPAREDVLEYVAMAGKLRDEMKATGVKLDDDLDQIIFLMSTIPDQYAA